MEAAVLRLAVARDAIDRVEKDPKNSLAQGALELAILQVRLLCELYLLGATAAHIEEGVEGVSDKKWRPKDVFLDLSKANIEHPLQLPVRIDLNAHGTGHHHAEWLSAPLPFVALSEIYGLCGDFLHVPTMRQVIKESLPSLELVRLKSWIDGFSRLTMGHALMLPERQTVMLCIWSGNSNERPQAFKLAAQGPSTADLSQLPEFHLLP